MPEGWYGPSAPSFGEAAPGEPPPYAEGRPPGAPPAAGAEAPPDFQLSQQFGGGGEYFVTNFAPPSIGDSFSPAPQILFRGRSTADFPLPSNISSPSGAALLGRVKLADNFSPLPRDRLFFDYNYFHNAAVGAPGLGLSRFAPGFETTFYDGAMSVEMRVPMVTALDSDLAVDFDGNYVGDITGGEFGNLQFMWKSLLVENDLGAIAGGLAVTAPTANDFHVSFVDGTPLLTVVNESVHIMPYIALLRRFGPDVFMLASVQADIDASGNPVLLNTFGDDLQRVGRLYDQTLVYADVSLGAWVHRDVTAPVLSGVALMLEGHYTASVDNMDTISAFDGRIVADPNQDLNMVNLTGGAHFVLGQNLVTVGYGVPVTNDRVFDGELRAYINRYY